MIKKLFICPYFGTLPPWFDSYLANIEMLKPLGYDWHITTNLKLFKERVGDILGIKCPIVPGTGKLWDYRPALGVLFPEEIRGYDYWGHTDFDCVYGRVDKFVTDEFLGLATPPEESRRDPAVDPRRVTSGLHEPLPAELTGWERKALYAVSDILQQLKGKMFDSYDQYFVSFADVAGALRDYSGERPDSAPLPPEAGSPNQKPLDIHSNHHNYICGPWTLYRNRDEVNGLFQLVANWQEFMVDPTPTGWVEKIFTDLVDWAAQQGTITRQYTHWQERNPLDTSGIRLEHDGTLIDSAERPDGHKLYTNGPPQLNPEIMMCHFRHTKEYPKGVKFV